jgi:hypothetical protein
MTLCPLDLRRLSSLLLSRASELDRNAHTLNCLHPVEAGELVSVYLDLYLCTYGAMLSSTSTKARTICTIHTSARSLPPPPGCALRTASRSPPTVRYDDGRPYGSNQ